MKLVIAGFMGAGKTTLQESWKNEFPGKCLDLDHLIAQEVGVTRDRLGDWIEEVGFPEFRRVETKVLSEVLQQNEHILLALGGGAFSVENQEVIQGANAKSLWVNLDPEACWDRVKDDSNRPLVKKGKESFLTLYKERLSLYKKADFTIMGTYPLPSWEEFCKSYQLGGEN